MKREEMICANCLSREDPQPGDSATDLCTIGPEWKPVTPGHHCGSGRWPGTRVIRKPPEWETTTVEVVLEWGEWDEE